MLRRCFFSDCRFRFRCFFALRDVYATPLSLRHDAFSRADGRRR